MKRPALLACLCLALAMPAMAVERSDFTYAPPGAGFAFGTVQPAPETSQTGMGSLGRRAGDNYCIPPQWNDSRGYMNLQEPGGNPGTCFFKSEVKTRQCECSIYHYRNVHQVGLGNDGSTSYFSPADYEEAENGSQCISKVPQSYVCCSYNPFGGGSCGTCTQYVCPGGAM